MILSFSVEEGKWRSGAVRRGSAASPSGGQGALFDHGGANSR
jgi:hypothetical protein